MVLLSHRRSIDAKSIAAAVDMPAKRSEAFISKVTGARCGGAASDTGSRNWVVMIDVACVLFPPLLSSSRREPPPLIYRRTSWLRRPSQLSPACWPAGWILPPHPRLPCLGRGSDHLGRLANYPATTLPAVAATVTGQSPGGGVHLRPLSHGTAQRVAVPQ